MAESDVLHIIENIKVSKVPGPGNISTRILKEVKHQISKPLSILFDKSIFIKGDQ